MRVEIFNISNFVYSKFHINKRQGTNHINSKMSFITTYFTKTSKFMKVFLIQPQKKISFINIFIIYLDFNDARNSSRYL